MKPISDTTPFRIKLNATCININKKQLDNRSFHFQLATTQLRLSTGAQWKKFIIYSLFGWTLPLTFTVVAVVVDRLKDAVPAEYRPGELEIKP